MLNEKIEIDLLITEAVIIKYLNCTPRRLAIPAAVTIYEINNRLKQNFSFSFTSLSGIYFSSQIFLDVLYKVVLILSSEKKQLAITIKDLSGKSVANGCANYCNYERIKIPSFGIMDFYNLVQKSKEEKDCWVIRPNLISSILDNQIYYIEIFSQIACYFANEMFNSLHLLVKIGKLDLCVNLNAECIFYITDIKKIVNVVSMNIKCFNIGEIKTVATIYVGAIDEKV